MDNTKKKSTGKRIALIIVCVVLALILLLMIAGSIWVNSVLNRLNRPEDVTLPDEEIENILNETDPVEEDFTGEVIDPEDIQMPDAPADEIETADHIINILLIGQDRRENQGRQRSDAMILCTINTENKTLVMTSFLRDLYVQLPQWNEKNYQDNRLNTTYAIGGMGMLDECLKQNFGVQVDHNIEVDFSGFEDIIDLVGGVDIELTAAEAGKVGGGAKAGMNHLNGEQALNYARIRKLDSDFGRTNRQRKVLTALLAQAKHMSLTQMNNLVNGIIPLITTDMSNGDILGYVMEFFPLLSDLEVTTQYIPAEGTYQGASVRGMSVLIPDMEANRQILRDTIG